MLTRAQFNGGAFAFTFSGPASGNILPWYEGFRFIIATATAPGASISPPLLSIWANKYRAGQDHWVIWNKGANSFDIATLNLDATLFTHTLSTDDVVKLGLTGDGFWVPCARSRAI